MDLLENGFLIAEGATASRDTDGDEQWRSRGRRRPRADQRPSPSCSFSQELLGHSIYATRTRAAVSPSLSSPFGTYRVRERRVHRP